MENKKELELIEKIKSEVNSAIEGNSKDTLKHLAEINKEIEAIKNSSNSEQLVKELAQVSADLKALKEQKSIDKKRNTTLFEGAFSFYKNVLEKNGAETIKRNKSFQDSIEIKAAATMTTANIDAVGTNSTSYNLADMYFGLVRTQRRQPFLMDICNVRTTNKMYVQWTEMANNDPGTAGSTLEGGDKFQEDFDVIEKSQKVDKVTAYTKVSLEMLDDVDFVEGEIKRNLIELVALKADSQILSGNGTSPQLAGLITLASAYSAGPHASSIDDPNLFDVLLTAIDQIRVANFQPTNIILHPSDATSMFYHKGSDFNYVNSQLLTQVGSKLYFAGLEVIQNTGITQGKFLVGDFNQSNVAIRKDAIVSMGYDGNDFTKNLITILCEMRLTHYVASNRVDAFSYGDIATAKSALLKV